MPPGLFQHEAATSTGLQKGPIKAKAKLAAPGSLDGPLLASLAS